MNQQWRRLCYVGLAVLYYFQASSSFSTETKTRRFAGEISNHHNCNNDDSVFQTQQPQLDRWLLIHWKGESVEGYSLRFRHDEFRSALNAIMNETTNQVPTISFADALSLNNNADISNERFTTIDPSPKRLAFVKEEAYNQAMQYVVIDSKDHSSSTQLDHFVKAAQRCSLVHALYLIVAESTTTYEVLSDMALEGAKTIDYFQDMKDPALSLSWCVRVRHYGSVASAELLPRYSHRARSRRREQIALTALTPLLVKFTGPVNLKTPDCKIYIFDGLVAPPNSDGVKVLTRRVAQGVRTARLNPNTRRCVTNTPLCPTAACLMCNIGHVRQNSAVLDPYAGSGSILLAAALLEPTCRTVGIEIAHDGLVDRSKIYEDFRIRDNMTPPIALLHGDCTDPLVRQVALAAADGGPFDCILTDPPYGIRESLVEQRPIDELLAMIRNDRESGTPLLRKGGRLVVFLPQPADMELSDMLPADDKIKEAGLQLELRTEQYLSDILSRWLVSFICIK